jgi:hypothetical protein
MQRRKIIPTVALGLLFPCVSIAFSTQFRPVTLRGSLSTHCARAARLRNAVCFQMKAQSSDSADDSAPEDDMVGRADLRGGTYQSRNTQIALLKKSFYSSTEFSQDLPDAEKVGGRGAGGRHYEDIDSGPWDSLLGLIPDLPLCRWQNVMLPGYNQVLNIWQVCCLVAACMNTLACLC